MQSVCDVWKQIQLKCFFLFISSLNGVLWTQFNSSPSDRILFSGSFCLFSFARALRFCVCPRRPYKSNFHTKLTSRFRYATIRLSVAVVMVVIAAASKNYFPDLKAVRTAVRWLVLPVLSALN